MATPTPDLIWRNVETDDIPVTALELYNSYKTLQRQAAAAREAFEAAFALALAITPTDPRRIVFGYKFGKLSIAIAPNDKPKPTPKRTTSTLSDFVTFHATVRSI
jgi:hypothetical protein